VTMVWIGWVHAFFAIESRMGETEWANQVGVVFAWGVADCQRLVRKPNMLHR
jgi:hypothetical protein